jgi:SAM-dependent methyltransferase
LNRGSTIASALKQWWRERRQSDGFLAAAGQLFALGFELLRDSLPQRKRQRYGDIEYDWEERVDTTAATVSGRGRLLGLLNSPYQPVEPALFRHMMNSLAIDFSQFTFVDIGSGKGRAVLLAAEFPFQRIIGIELLPELNRIAEENIRKFLRAHPRSPTMEVHCVDAGDFVFPVEAAVLFLNNPLPETALARLLEHLERSLGERPRPTFLLYANPVRESVIAQCAWLVKITGTQPYAVFRNVRPGKS